MIDQAIGLIRGRTGRSVEDAFTHLRAISRGGTRTLAHGAQQMVDEAVRRARVRHSCGASRAVVVPGTPRKVRSKERCLASSTATGVTRASASP